MNKVPARATTTEQLSLIYPSDTDSARRKRIRTEGFGIKFEKTSDSPEAQRCAVGWAFDVPVEFREQLDILYSVLADKKANEALKKKLGVKKLDPNQRKYRNAWTRGVPPALSFSAGIFFTTRRASALWSGVSHYPNFGAWFRLRKRLRMVPRRQTK